MRRRTVIFGLIATSCAPSTSAPTTSWALITQEDALRAEATPRPPGVSASAALPPPQPGAPMIEVIRPDVTQPVTTPVTVQLRFVPQVNSTINVNSFQASATRGWFTIDVTDRILQHAKISESGLIAENAEIPTGNYTVTFKIPDNVPRLGIRTFQFTIV